MIERAIYYRASLGGQLSPQEYEIILENTSTFSVTKRYKAGRLVFYIKKIASAFPPMMRSVVQHDSIKRAEIIGVHPNLGYQVAEEIWVAELAARTVLDGTIEVTIDGPQHGPSIAEIVLAIRTDKKAIETCVIYYASSLFAEIAEILQMEIQGPLKIEPPAE